MAIEIKPEKEKKLILPSSFNVLFYYSIILLFFSISSYLLVSQWSSRLEAEVSKKAEVFERLENQENFKKNQDLILDQKLQIDNYLFLYNEKITLDNFFLLLEKMIHPLATIETASLDTSDNSLMVEGSTLNYDSLEQQYSILKNFEMERRIVGWVKANQVEEEEENVSIKNKKSLDLYKNPLKEGERIVLEEITEVDFLQKIEADDYAFGRNNKKVFRNDWYEVVAYEKIKPIEKVELTEINPIDDEFKIGFNFDIELNSLIFNK